MEYNRAQLKRSVRQAMRHTAPAPMLVTLLFGAVVSVGSGLVNSLLGRLLTAGYDLRSMLLYLLELGYEVEEALEQVLLILFSRGFSAMFTILIGNVLLAFAISLWEGLMDTGYSGYALSMARRENPPLGRIFCAFPNAAGVLLTRIFTGLFTLLWALVLAVGYSPLVFCAGLIVTSTDSLALAAVLGAALSAAYLLSLTAVTLRYALVDFVLIDRGLIGLDAIRESKRLMRGNTGRALVLRLSFLGWYLLLGAAAFAGLFAAFTTIAGAAFSGAGLGELAISAGTAMLIAAAAAIVGAALSLWLKPYTAGAMARFYDWAGGTAQPVPGGSDYGAGGWGGPADYTRTSSPSSGTGIGSDSGNGGPNPPPRPKPPADDPWD